MINSNLVLLLFIIFNFLLIINFSKIKILNLNIDKPDNIRKIHNKPVALGGGIILLLNILLYWLIIILDKDFIEKDIIFENFNSINNFMIIYLSIFFLGFFDDKYNINANLKFVFLTFIILVLLLLEENLIINRVSFSFYPSSFTLGNLSIFFSIFCFVVFLNAFNMFDGINLQSISYSIIIFACIHFFFIESFFIKILFIFSIGFSYLNFKNKSFLGDSGTLTLAFIISFVFIKLHNLDYIKYADDVIIYMIIPGLDLIRLFILRIYKKRSPLSPDRLHLHHLLLLKFNVNKAVLIILSLIALPIFLNFNNFNNSYSLIVTITTYLVIIFYTRNKI